MPLMQVDLKAWTEQKVQNNHPIELRDARTTLHHTCMGLAALHAAGGVHNDLTPGNLVSDGQ
eukprot:18397-Eustigmatos_ZCMA.PRE.1